MTPEVALRAYDLTAPVYDAFTAHHDYDAWTDAIEAHALRHGLSGRRMLDVGCGTGKSFLPWRRRGFEVTGCDVSEAMLERAAAKAPDVPLTVTDARDLPALGTFDLVLALDDVLNHVSTEELPGTFASLASVMAPHGLLVFDVNTARTFETFFAECQAVLTDEVALVWQGLTHGFAPGGEGHARLDAFTPDGAGGWTRSTAFHTQAHHPLPAVADALTAAGLTVRGLYGQGFDAVLVDPPDERRHTKALFFAAFAHDTEEGR
jgi:SAM-dependent methyltransferase